MKIIKKWRLLLALSIVIGVITMLSFNHFYWSEGSVRERILAQVPLGSTMEEVLEFIWEQDEWMGAGVGPDVDRDRLLRPWATPNTEDEPRPTMRIRIASRRSVFIFQRNMWAYWQFSEDGYLLELVVIRTLNLAI